MRLSSNALSDVGRVRKNNEDAFYSNDELGVYAVADGVGGSRAGEDASRIFCEVVEQHAAEFHEVLGSSGQDPGQLRSRVLGLMESVFQRATEAIYRMGERHRDKRGMSTTGIVLAVGKVGAVLGHVGDSRAFLMRNGREQRLTVDHTLAQEMLSQGLITQEELGTFPHRHVLARSVGQLPTVRVDTAWLDLGEGDRVLMCTDGLYGPYQRDDELCKMVTEAGLEAALNRANRKGGDDNLTGVVVHVSQTDAPEYDDQVTVDTQAKLLCIQSLFLFRYLTPEETVRVLKIVFEESFKKDDNVFEEGTPGDRLYMVYSGKVDVMKGEHHLTSIGPGGHFGELAFMDGHPRSATVTARESTTMLTIKRDDFRSLTRTEPVIASKLLWCFVLNMSGRLRDLSQSYVTARKNSGVFGRERKKDASTQVRDD